MGTTASGVLGIADAGATIALLDADLALLHASDIACGDTAASGEELAADGWVAVSGARDGDMFTAGLPSWSGRVGALVTDIGGPRINDPTRRRTHGMVSSIGRACTASRIGSRYKNAAMSFRERRERGRACESAQEPHNTG